jgi:putative membrane protein
MFRHSKASRSNDARRKRAERKPEKKRKPREIKLLGGLAAGVIGGLVATWALDCYQKGSLQAVGGGQNAEGATPIFSRRQGDDMEEQRAYAAEHIAKSTFGKYLTRSQRRRAAPLVHYAVGALTGGIYGLTAEVLPIVRRGYGTGYSNLLFLSGSEAVLPWFNLRRSKSRSSRSGGLSGPLVYGAALETTRRVVRWIL